MRTMRQQEDEAIKTWPKRAIMLVGVVVVVAPTVINVISLLSGGGGKSSDCYVCYVKDREIFFTDLKKDSEAWQLTSELIDTSRPTDSAVEDKDFLHIEKVMLRYLTWSLCQSYID